jgi:hypothetical protein
MCPHPDPREIEFDCLRDLPDRRFLPGAESHPVQRVLCTRIGSTLQADVRIECETATERFPLEERLYRLSPSGFEFGYLGAGPHALAWNILGLLLPPKEAHRLSQHFKEEFVATLDRDGGVIELSAVRDWIQRTWERDRAGPERMAEEAELRQLLAEIEALDHLEKEEGEVQ